MNLIFNRFEWAFSADVISIIVGMIGIITLIWKYRDWLLKKLAWLNLQANLIILCTVIICAITISQKIDTMMSEISTIKNKFALLEDDSYLLESNYEMKICAVSSLSAKKFLKPLNLMAGYVKTNSNHIDRQKVINNVLEEYHRFLSPLDFEPANTKIIDDMIKSFFKKEFEGSSHHENDGKSYNEMWASIIKKEDESKDENDDLNLKKYIKALPFVIYEIKDTTSKSKRLGILFPKSVLRLGEAKYEVLSIGNPKNILRMRDSVIISKT